MRILYGVVGEGMGHATRSKAVIDHLIHDEGHQVEVMVSGRAHDMLQDYFEGVHRIWGLSMRLEDNELKLWSSILDNVKKAFFEGGLPDNIEQYFELTDRFDPECVISDFESWSYFYGKAHDLPVLCIDNIQMMARCSHPKGFLDLHRKDYELAKNFTRAKLPRSTHYYIPTFFYPEVRKPRTTLVPPVLRQAILDAQTSTAGHVLVYQTSTSCTDLPQVLAGVDVPFVVYGYRRDIDGPVTEGNITYKPFDAMGFVDDLASARGVITNGGFTLMSEAVYLRKPVLSIPLTAQFEQALNAHYLEECGYGYGMDVLDDHTLRYFLERLQKYRDNLEGYRQEEGNGVLFQLLDEHLDRIAADV